MQLGQGFELWEWVVRPWIVLQCSHGQRLATASRVPKDLNPHCPKAKLRVSSKNVTSIVVVREVTDEHTEHLLASFFKPVQLFSHQWHGWAARVTGQRIEAQLRDSSHRLSNQRHEQRTNVTNDLRRPPAAKEKSALRYVPAASPACSWQSDSARLCIRVSARFHFSSKDRKEKCKNVLTPRSAFIHDVSYPHPVRSTVSLRRYWALGEAR